VASVGYALLMAFAAVYLDHHWVVDVIAGDAFSVVVFAVARSIAIRMERTASWSA